MAYSVPKPQWQTDEDDTNYTDGIRVSFYATLPLAKSGFDRELFIRDQMCGLYPELFK